MSEVTMSVLDGLARITLDRPPLNVLTTTMLRDLEGCLRQASADPSARVVRLDARGRAFSAGVDVADHLGDKVGPMMDALADLFVAFEEIEAPTVAVVDGAALGGGCELCLGCDLCVASARSSFGQPEIRLGLFAPPASVLLPRKVGERRAMRLLLEGQPLDATRAHAIGLVDELLPTEGFDESAEASVARLLGHSGAALRLAKRAVRLGTAGSVTAAHREVDRLYREGLMRTEDALEGLAAFGEKRAPRWKHR